MKRTWGWVVTWVRAHRLTVWLGVWVLFGVGLTTGALWGAWDFFDGRGPAEESTYDTIRTAIAAVGVISIGGGAAIAFRRQATLEAQSALDHRKAELEDRKADLEDRKADLDRRRADLDAEKEARSKVADLHARYQQVAAQLGHDKPLIRIAGVYALEALADEWTRQGDIDQRDVCIDLLCGYLRSPATPTPQSTPEAPVLDPAEAEVRSTITTVIARHLQDPKSPTSWSDHNYNFTGATLANTNFNKATFNGYAMFHGATFNGDAWFGMATFTADAVFGGATFTGAAGFIGATFTSTAGFNRATFTRDAVFNEATFTGDAWFNEATFTGDAMFDEATFAKGVPPEVERFMSSRRASTST